MDKNKVEALLKRACSDTVGLLPTGFLCQSLGVLDPKEPYMVRGDIELQEAVAIMRDKKIGCLVVVDSSRKMLGIFTERDLLTKGFGQDPEKELSEFMTKNPTSASLMDPMAYALNLMSHGGFRHLPLIDQDGDVVGIISIKDIVDFIAGKMTESLMAI